MEQRPIFRLWSQQANNCVAAIEDIKKPLWANIQRLDNDHPDWKARDEAASTEWSKHEARRFFFMSLKSTLVNAQLCYMFFADNLCSEKWWAKQAAEYNPATIHLQVEEYGRTIRWFTFYQVATITEETIRAIIRSAPSGDFDIAPSQVADTAFYTLYTHLLQDVSLTTFQPLFNILRQTRNTIHTNGIFSPPYKKKKDVSYNYKGKQFDFKVGKDSDWFTESFVRWMIQELNEAMFEIVTAPQIALISFCTRSV